MFHHSGLEEYCVDGEVVHKSRAWEYSGVREFTVGDDEVRVRFSIPRMYCKAYVNGRLVAREVFPEMKKLRQKRRGYGPPWVAAIRFLLVVHVTIVGMTWVLG
ncbi:MAG: hypothetical protein QNJ00_02890 [Woeseiaceae bacterium]|nr:hypothetical protein [Woeseiaceae bacterium]